SYWAKWAGQLSAVVWPLGQQVGPDIEAQVLPPDQQAQAQAQMVADLTNAMTGLGYPLVNLPQFIPGQFPQYLNDLAASVKQTVQVAVTGGFVLALAALGLPQASAMGADGFVHNNDVTIDGKPVCMDSGYYHPDRQPLPGNGVAVNVCDGNP